MKKTLIALALAAVIPVAAYPAMEGYGSHERGARFERMAEDLNLDDMQKKLNRKSKFARHHEKGEGERHKRRDCDADKSS